MTIPYVVLLAATLVVAVFLIKITGHTNKAQNLQGSAKSLTGYRSKITIIRKNCILAQYGY
jgi:hypothetical protein